MTVLVWCSWVVSAAGGFERVALSIANGLAREGHKTILIGPYSNVPILQGQIDPEIQVIDHHTSPTISSLIASSRLLKAAVREYKVDVLSAHGSVFPLLDLDVPVLWTEHAIRYPDRPMLAGPRGLLWSQVRKRLISNKWYSICVSQFVLNSLRQKLRLGDNIGTVVHNAVPDALRLKQLPPPRMSPPYQLGFVGRHEVDKRPFDVFELDEQLKKRDVPCQWHIFGEGSMTEAIKTRAAREGGRVTVHGYLPDITDVFRKIDLLFLPSHLEGLPTVCLEARLARRLLAGWHVSGIPEAAGDHAVLAPSSFEMWRLADAVAAALDSGKTAPPDPEGAFEPATMISNYEALLDQAAHKHSSRRYTISPPPAVR